MTDQYFVVVFWLIVLVSPVGWAWARWLSRVEDPVGAMVRHFYGDAAVGAVYEHRFTGKTLQQVTWALSYCRCVVPSNWDAKEDP